MRDPQIHQSLLEVSAVLTGGRRLGGCAQRHNIGIPFMENNSGARDIALIHSTMISREPCPSIFQENTS